MIRILAQAILSAAGVIAALFVPAGELGYPIVQAVVALIGIVIAAVLSWYGDRLLRWMRRRKGDGRS